MVKKGYGFVCSCSPGLGMAAINRQQLLARGGLVIVHSLEPTCFGTGLLGMLSAAHPAAQSFAQSEYDAPREALEAGIWRRTRFKATGEDWF